MLNGVDAAFLTVLSVPALVLLASINSSVGEIHKFISHEIGREEIKRFYPSAAEAWYFSKKAKNEAVLAEMLKEHELPKE